MSQSYSVEAILSAVDRGFTSTLSQAEKTVNGFSNGGSAGIKAVGTAMMVTGAAITAFGATSLESFGQFQKSINQAAIIAGGSSKDIKALSDEANKLGQTLPISAQEAADAMTEMARNGASVKDIKNAFPPIARAAAATGEDLSSTASVVQQSMNLWGGGMKNATKYSALLTATANKSNAQISDMQQVLANVGGTATNMGMSLKDVASAAGILTNSGIPAAQASQDLNHALVAMEAPSSLAKKKMSELGISFTDAKGNMKSFPSILKEVANATDGMGKAQKAAALKTMFGTAGMNAMLPLLKSVNGEAKSGNTDWNSWSKALDAAGGSYQKASKYLIQNTNKMQKNVGAQLDQTKDAFNSLTNASYQAQSKGIQGFLMKVQDMIGELAGGNSALDKMVRTFIGLSPVIGPAMTAVGGFLMSFSRIASFLGGAAKGFLSLGKSVVGLVAKMFGVATSSTAAAAGEKAAGSAAKTSAKEMLAMGTAVLEIGVGIGAVIASVALLVFSITSLAKTGDNGVRAMVAFGLTVAGLAVVFAVLGPALTASSAGLLAFGVAIVAAGAGVALFGAGVLAMGAGVKLAGAGILQLVQAFVLLGQNMTMVIPTLAALGTGFAVMLQNFVVGVTTMIPQVIALLISMIQQLLTQLAAAIPSMMAAGVQIIVGILNGLATGMPQIVAAATNLIVNFLGALTAALPRLIAAGVSFIVALLEGIAQNIGKLISAGTDALVNFLEGVADNLPRVIKAGVDVIVAFIEGIANNLGRIINAGLDLIAKFIMGIVNAIPRLAGIAVQAVEKFVYGVGNALGQVLASGGKLIQMFVKGVLDGMSKSQSAGRSNANSAKSGISGVSLVSAGAHLMSGFISGIRSMAGAVMSAAAGLAHAAVSKIQSALKIHSPSRVMRDQVGKYVSLGMAVGMTDNLNSVANAANKLRDSALVTVPAVNASNFNASLKQLNSKLSSSSLNDQLNVNYTQGMVFETHVDLNGREIALATADDMTEIQNRKNTEYNRVRGYRS